MEFSAQPCQGCSYSTPNNILVFSETTRPIKFKFHMKTTYDKLAQIFTNCSGHMTKMATMPIYGKKPLKILQNQKADAIRTWYVALGM